MVLQAGFFEVQTPDGTKITKGDGVFFLIAPSDGYLKAAAFDSLNVRSRVQETGTFPNGSWERTNDYDARVRIFQEKDSGGGNVGKPFRVPIGEDEVNEQRIQGRFEAFKTSTLALPDVAIIKGPLVDYLKYVEGRENPDTNIPAAIRLEQKVGRVGDAITMEIRIDVGAGGLAGYNFQATIITDTIGKFTDVTFLPAIPLNDHIPDPVDGPLLTTISGVDIGAVIGPNTPDVLLATLNIQLLAAGASRVILGVTSLDDDSGSAIVPTITQGSITAV